MKKGFYFMALVLLTLTFSACKNEDAATTVGTASSEPKTQRAYEQAQAAFTDNKFEEAVTILKQAPQTTQAEKEDIVLEIEGIRLYQTALEPYELDQLKTAQNKLAGQTIDSEKYQIAYVKLNALKKAIQREIESPRYSSTKETKAMRQSSTSSSTTSTTAIRQTQSTTTTETTTSATSSATSQSSEAAEEPGSAAQLEADWQATAAGLSTSKVSVMLKNLANQPVKLSSEQLRLRFSDGTELFPALLPTETVQPNQTVTFSDVFTNFSDQQALQGFELFYGDKSILNQAAQTDQAVEAVTTSALEPLIKS